ncbi:hypothetical protein SYNPS1DRAFT_22269 [Syncephalis pseudoplumigaleata]|uniref:GIT Spa2 homology (SHD) domain-containing protein n=1 Tax=Syncephalis pseudoplumigaleata TaxID=1712513 RepID=A0A4P9Z0E6_9FUNG|nr:hypothetical protein SYNPS1DRAFT_22269 [Syncephalis pseudoplumigaleata]|eukprot:RKP25854.1 hypothetical protein SYNPS1DRAFT_22269 [Syncephalis pseudoplumigaleata]
MSAEIARTHYTSLKRYLYQHLLKERNGVSAQRRSAREKLVRLTLQQFQELSTDVYDELVRRESNDPTMPFLAVKSEFHPKRNQARQKLATLPKTRFKDLASDVFAELDRRYPHFGQEVANQFPSNGHGHTDGRTGGGSPEESDVDRTAVASPPVNNGSGGNRTDSTQPGGSMEGVAVHGIVVPERAEAVMENNSMLDYTVHPRPTSNGQSVNLDSLDDLMHEMAGIVNNKKKDGAEATEDDVNATRLRALEDEVAHYQEANNRLQADLRRLQADYNSLHDELETQHQNSGSLREETETLMASIRELSLKNEEINTEREGYEATIKELSDENKTLRRSLEEARRELRAIKATSTYIRENPKMDFSEHGLLQPTDDGVLEQSHVTSFQLGIDSLLRAIRSETANQCLLAMKAVVMACKGLLQDVEVYEQSNRPGPDRAPLPDTKTRLGNSLNVLVTAVRNHITAGGVSPPGIVDAAASEVTGNVVAMVRMLHVNAATAKQLPNGQGVLSPIDEGASSVGYGSDIQAAYEGRSNGSTPYNNSPARSRRTSLQSNGMSARTNAVSPPSSLSRAPVAVYDVEDLKVYLEQRTDEIVQAIHTLLALIRAPRADAQELHEAVLAIRTTVDDVIAASRRTFNSPNGNRFRMEGEQVLTNLDQSNRHLYELKETYPLDGPADKASKQALAGAAFEIAKHTKELVALIEDSSDA